MEDVMKKILLILAISVLLFSCAKRINYSFLQKINREGYETANAVVIIDSIGIDLESSGKYVSTQHKLVKILTMKGKAWYSEATFGYFTLYDTVVVEMARVISPDGKVMNVPKEDIKDVKIPAFSKFFLPNVRMKKIIFPNVEEGSSVEYVVKDIMQNPPMEDNFDTYILFEGKNPVIKKVYSVASPISLNWKVKNDEDQSVKFQESKKNGKTTYKWSIQNVPGIVEEPMMPPMPDVCKKLLITSVPSWEVWSKWYWDLCKDKFTTNDTMNSVIDSVLVGRETREDSIRALYYYVSKNIRYVGTKMSGKKGGYEPFPATKCFRDKYGVCRDKACLLAAMLRKAGFDAYTVLTNPMLDVEEDIPVDQFNHAITAVREKDGSFLYIDPTIENTREFLSSIEQGKGVLVCDEDGEDLEYTPKVSAEENLFSMEAEGHLEENGNLNEVLTWKLFGLMDMSFRSLLTMLPPEQMKQIFQSMVSGMATGAVLDTFYYSDPKDLYQPLEITLGFHAENYGLNLGETFSFKTPLSGGGTGNISFGGGGNPFDLDERKYPLYLYTTLKFEVKEKIYIPEGYEVEELPENFEKDVEFFKVESRYEVNDGYILHYSESVMNEFVFSPEQYKIMKSIFDEASQKSGQEIVLKKIAH
ncbi:MAG: DUF3857 and transglutaminase domain-containing protein [Candidatus Cloacimonetes bacterium]|nr:DUF3857 and transglutaminase domain-containing protein [Candidatus Cloacimonadota bacterium]